MPRVMAEQGELIVSLFWSWLAGAIYVRKITDGETDRQAYSDKLIQAAFIHWPLLWCVPICWSFIQMTVAVWHCPQLRGVCFSTSSSFSSTTHDFLLLKLSLGGFSSASQTVFSRLYRILFIPS